MGDSFTKQVSIYLGKCFRIFKNEKTWKCFIATIIIGLIVCFVTGDEMFVAPLPTQKGNFALASACIWLGIFNSIQSICRERSIVKREHRTGMMIPAYLSAHFIYEAVLCFVESLLMTIMVSLFTADSFPSDGILLPAVIEIFIDFFLILYSSDMLGILVSCICRSETSAMTVMPFILIVQLVFAGLIFKLEDFTKTISSLTISRWGLNMLCVTSDVNGLEGLWEFSEEYEFLAEHQINMWLILLLFCVIYGLLSMLFLSTVNHDKR